MNEFLRRNFSKEGLILSFWCILPSFVAVIILVFLLGKYGLLRGTVDLYRDADVTGLLAFLGLVCGFAYSKRKEQFIASSTFLCGFLFGAFHLLLQIFPKFQDASFHDFFFLQIFFFIASLGLLTSAGVHAILAHDIVIKRKEL